MLKHPALRVAAWQWIAPEYQDMIADAIVRKAVPTLPFRPVRVELVGSVVRGCAHLDSDFDLNLAASDWNEQVAWRRVWDDPQHRLAFNAALKPLMDALGIRIEVAPNNPDQYEYDICYDFLARSLADPRGTFPDRTARWWDGYQLKWRERPLLPKPLEFAFDGWSQDERTLWQGRYGGRYLTYHALPILRQDGTPEVREGMPITKLIADIYSDARRP